MNRSSNIKLLNNNKKFDFIVIGGGASGLGCALDVSSRGYSVVLLEKFDFCKG
ncbi:FAD-dependent oxidoreductase, partial [Flavobacteriaceae bacterium]|nr:FAD-dependent oxidoreductase [Flavobacteriaceae bacterium]